MQQLIFDKKGEFRFTAWETLLIIGLAVVPLFTSFPYRVNIFLSWEGAYRMSEGQLPYRDFGIPMGYMYWVIPSLFFKLFGAKMITLIKAQVLINIMAGFAFRSILKSLTLDKGVRFLSVFLFCICYSFFNFWPWYNHSVIVFGLVALAFLMKFMFASGKWKPVSLIAAGLFTAVSFMTKQDGGGITFLICLVLLVYEAIHTRKWLPLAGYVSAFGAFTFLFIFPFLQYDFKYWFNYGQAPHTARVSLFEVADEFFFSSQWIKFYLFIIGLLLVGTAGTFRSFISNKRETVFLLLTLGILTEAAIFQITSYTPPDNNIFFHAFAFAYILSKLSAPLRLNFSKLKPLAVVFFGICLWWSSLFWKYVQKVTARFATDQQVKPVPGGENIVNRKTYMIEADTAAGYVPVSEWAFSNFKSLEKIYLPRQTIEGMERLKALAGADNQKRLSVLNMTELTTLAVELPYRTETGPGYPLWHHLGVAMFNREAARFEKRITRREYDLALFEYIPGLNNFYPFRVRDSLIKHYQKIDSFPAPRSDKRSSGYIEVYTPK
jgi:hypothetical protein